VAATLGLVPGCEDPERLPGSGPPLVAAQALGGAGSHVMLLAEHGVQPKMPPQGVPETKSVENRMYLDIECADVEGEARRLEARRLEARRLERLGEVRVEGPRSRHGPCAVADGPGGNEFCACDDGQAG
jgi:hypothetical protein